MKSKLVLADARLAISFCLSSGAVHAGEVDLTTWQPPPPRVWQCNDIRVTETVLQPGVVHYDLGGTIWGGSQFTLNINNGDMFFNGHQCVMLRS